jgi:plasmid stabilization system protein ParE
MPKYRIVLEEESRRNIDTIYSWIAARSPDGASRWYRALLNALDNLLDDADRFPIAPESRYFDKVVRNLSFRMRSGRVYRVLFTLIGDEVHILFVRAPGQDSAQT